MNWLSHLPWANSFMSPEVDVRVAYFPMVKPKYGERNWVKFNAGKLKLSPADIG